MFQKARRCSLAAFPPLLAGPCIGTKDTACFDVCPVDCIHPRKDQSGFEEVAQLYIDPNKCIDCGANVPVCPVAAVFPKDDLPERWAHFANLNADFYQKKVQCAPTQKVVDAESASK